MVLYFLIGKILPGMSISGVVAGVFAVAAVFYAVMDGDSGTTSADVPGSGTPAAEADAVLRAGGATGGGAMVTAEDPELAKTAPKYDPYRGKGGAKVWTIPELVRHNGSDPSLPLMLVVMGQVFDVSRGKEHCEITTHNPNPNLPSPLPTHTRRAARAPPSATGIGFVGALRAASPSPPSPRRRRATQRYPQPHQ